MTLASKKSGLGLEDNLVLALMPWPLVTCNECALCSEFLVFVRYIH